MSYKRYQPNQHEQQKTQPINQRSPSFSSSHLLFPSFDIHNLDLIPQPLILPPQLFPFNGDQSLSPKRDLSDGIVDLLNNGRRSDFPLKDFPPLIRALDDLVVLVPQNIMDADSVALGGEVGAVAQSKGFYVIGEGLGLEVLHGQRIIQFIYEIDVFGNNVCVIFVSVNVIVIVFCQQKCYKFYKNTITIRIHPFPSNSLYHHQNTQQNQKSNILSNSPHTPSLDKPPHIKPSNPYPHSTFFHMSIPKRHLNHKLAPPQRQQIPSIRQSPLNKLSNQQRLKEIYKSASTKEKEKSKAKNGRRFYLPIPDKKLRQGEVDNEPKTTGRYQSYLHGEQTDSHYQQLSHRYQPNYRTNNKRYAQNDTKNDTKNDISANIEPNSAFRRKPPNPILSEIDTSLRKDSSKNIQKQLNELNLNMKHKNSKKIHNLEPADPTSRYRGSSTHDQHPYQLDMFKIRKSTKKSLSGSLSKKPSEDSIREESKMIDHPMHRASGTKSQLTSPKNDLLEQGKLLFKSGEYQEAMRVFQKGQENQPKNLGYRYNIALIYLKQHAYGEGLKLLESIIEVDPSFKKTVYLFAVISSKHLQKPQKALDLANKGLQIYPTFLDLIFYRGKIHKDLHNVDPAIEDMQKVISMQKDHVQAHYHLTFLYFQKQLMTHAMSALSSAIYHDQDRNSEWRVEAIKLRARLYLADGRVKQAKKDILRLKSQKQSKNAAQLYYLQGKLQVLENNISDALINFEKCLREKDSLPLTPSHSISAPQSMFAPISTSELLIPSLLQICKSKINVKDFYSAYHHINRAKHFLPYINENDDSLLRFRHFIEGVVFLMKRKIDEGMKDFQRFKQVQSRLTPSSSSTSHSFSHSPSHSPPHTPSLYLSTRHLTTQLTYFYPSFHLYRAFGYFMQNNHSLAIRDYEEYQRTQPLDKYTLYNLFLAKGITKIEGHQFQEAVEYFNKAEQLFLKSQVRKVEPYIYRAMTGIEMARVKHLGGMGKGESDSESGLKDKTNNDMSDDSEIKALQLVFDALKQLDKAYDLNDSNSNLLFIRSLIYAYLNKFQQSLDDIIKAISKSQQNVPKYFFFRGMLQSTLSNPKQALNDFNISINLDPAYAAVYLQRAKLYFELQNYSKALEDLVKLKELRPTEDVEYHKAALYLVNGLYQMAEEASEGVVDEERKREVRFYVALEMFMLKQAEEQLVEEDEEGGEGGIDRVLVRFLQKDYGGLVGLIQEEKTSKPLADRLKYFTPVHYYHLLGCAYFNLGQYERALQEFSIALKECNLRDMEKSVGSFVSTNKKEDTDEQDLNLGDKDANCITYNIFLCHMKLNDIKKAYEVFIKEIMSIDEKLQKSQFMINFSHLLFQAMKRASSPRRSPDSKDSSFNIQASGLSNDDKQQATVQLFTNKWTVSCDNQVLIETSTFFLRTKLCYLNIHNQALRVTHTCRLHPSYVLTWLNVKQIENRPQPPWVKRQPSDEGLIFTDSVQNINIEFQTTQHDEEDEDEDDEEEGSLEEGSEEEEENAEDCEYEGGKGSGGEGSSGELGRRFDPRRFRDQMRLGDEVERKLNRIVNMGKGKEGNGEE